MNTIRKAAYEGDIVSRLRHWRGLHLAHGGDLYEEAAAEIERLRSVGGGSVDSQQPVAWAGLLPERIATFDRKMLFGKTATDVRVGARALNCDIDVFPLYRHPQTMLTDAEREAVPLYRTPQPDATPGEGSSRGECRSPDAWVAFAADGSESSAVYLLREQAEAAASEWGWFVLPLYRQPQPMLTDEEREKDFLLKAIRRLANQDATLSVCDGAVTVTMDGTLTDAEREAMNLAIDLLNGVEDVSAGACARADNAAGTIRKLLERLA